MDETAPAQLSPHIYRTKPPTSVKLFVGQIPKAYNEEDLKPLFDEFGSVYEVSVIRDRAAGTHKGCAFVTYNTKSEADRCISALHNAKCLPPLSNPLQVRYADGEAERIGVSAWSQIATTPTPSEYEHKLFVGMVPKTVTEEDLRPIFEPFGTIQELTVLRGPDGESKGCAFLKYETKDQAVAAIHTCNGQVFLHGSTHALVVKFAEKKQPQLKMQEQMLTLKTQQLENLLQQLQNPSLAYATQYNLLANPLAAQLVMSGVTAPPAAMRPVATPQTEGPPGSNLFIYHLPQHYTDQDLIVSFSPFGNVISAKVFIDKHTGQSKCFGFVSYDNSDSAHNAIAHMNGAQVGDKRLKVQLKRSTTTSRPY